MPAAETDLEKWTKYRTELMTHYGGEIDAAKRLYATFAPVFFAVSLAFLKDIVNWPEAAHKWLVYTSWSCFVLVITLTLVSYLASAEAAIKQFGLYNDFFTATGRMLSKEVDSQNYRASRRLQKRSDKWLRRNRFVSAFIFFAAMVLLVVFIGLNNA